MKRTPLFAAHQRLGARLIEFGGWEMPVQYTSIVDEHLAVRKAAGIFDISHMGQILVAGPDAEAFLNRALTNDARKLEVGQGQYTILCNERGGAIDDLYTYRLDTQEYLLIVNASRTDADVSWLRKQLAASGLAGLELKNMSDLFGAVAVQGPRVAVFIAQCFPGNSRGGAKVAQVTDLKKNQIAQFESNSQAIWVSRTGYTGEDGFEVVVPAALMEVVWMRLLDAGRAFGIKPAGLGARDTLRTEVCYPLYGHELDENTTPIEAGLGFFVALDKGEFVGRSVLAAQKANGVSRRLIAFKMTERAAPPRPQYPIRFGAQEARGTVTSGTQSPSLGVGIGLGYVPVEFAKSQTRIEIEIRGRRAPAVVAPKPLYRSATSPAAAAPRVA